MQHLREGKQKHTNTHTHTRYTCMHSYFGFVVRLFFELWPFNGLCHSLPQMYARGTMTRKYHQVSSRRRTNVPDEILTICGGKFTTRNRLAAHRRCGEVVVGAEADRCDGWWRWFVGCLQHKSKHLFGLSRRFLFVASIYVHLFSVLLPNLKFCWPKGKLLKMSGSLQLTVVLTEPGRIGKCIA